jgi:hypothetical protein
MTTTARQNNLILNQDWTRIYQTFKNADFKSYDFENLRRVIITYLRENYPEDFNDYIESSEYMALIDAVAFLGQSLAFRVDLASRENFIELAERRESVLRIARMLSYNAKRNVAAQGLLKFTSVTTTEEILDSSGRNLAQQIVSWNDPTNANWAEQFILILNSAMADNTEFGRSQGSSVIQGINTEQYRFRTNSIDVPIYSYSKTVAGRNMAFELVSTSFKDSESVYEEPPIPGNQLGFVYRNDGKGPASSNTGFYLMFKQGSLELADFGIGVPTTNEKIAVDSSNINNDDVWLFSLDAVGRQQNLWTQVSSLIGNNIAYNSIEKNIRDIYAVQTRESDRIDLLFADGIYGNLPQGAFRVYYRVSNGLSYSIAPNEMRGINITIPYINSRGIEHTLTIGLGLQYTVANSSETESLDSVRTNAPASYYTQNRMITAEDYNLAPLTSSQDILKVKSINRTSSGISRNYEIIDASGKYSSVNVFADDGYIYQTENEKILNFKFTGRIDIINFLRRSFEPALASVGVYNFYLSKFDIKSLVGGNDIQWRNVTTDVNSTTGYFIESTAIKPVGPYTQSNLRFVVPGALVKIVPPAGYAFEGTKIVPAVVGKKEQYYKTWSKIIKVVGDGTGGGDGILNSKFGAITLNEVIPTGENVYAKIESVIPKFIFDFSSSLENEVTNQIFQNKNFGLRFDSTEASWKIISASNLDLVRDFSIDKAGDSTNSNVDASWIASFVRDGDQYIVTIRTLDYVFGSIQQNRFYFDANERAYNDATGLVGKDTIKILEVNSIPGGQSSIRSGITFEVSDTIKFDDGYESSKEIVVAFSDKDNDGVIDDPECFTDLVVYSIDDVPGPESFIFFKETETTSGASEFVITSDILPEHIFRREADIGDITQYADGALLYFYDVNENRIKRVNRSTNTLSIAREYKGSRGRKDIKFQYIHNASTDRRIDPSSTNIIDVYLLTRSYDADYRKYLSGVITTKPEAPSSEGLRVSFGSKLGSIKSISDEIIYHPVRYKVLFGQSADSKLQAQFKIVKNPSKAINDNDLKVRVVNAISEFFDVANWDFGDRFYLGELVTYVVNATSPDVSNMIILPRQTNQSFGSLFEIQSGADELFVSGATVDDVEIVSSINAAEVRADPTTIVNVA